MYLCKNIYHVLVHKGSLLNFADFTTLIVARTDNHTQARVLKATIFLPAIMCIIEQLHNLVIAQRHA